MANHARVTATPSLTYEYGTCPPGKSSATWAAEVGVWKPLKNETTEAAKKRLKSAQREMRTIAGRLKEARLLVVRRRIRAADLFVFPPGQMGVNHPSRQPLVDPCQIGVNHPYLDRGQTPLSMLGGSVKEASASRTDAHRSNRAVRTRGTGGTPRSKAVAPPPTDPRAAGYGCEVCTDTGLCPGDDGRVQRCDCYQTNPVILARQADRRAARQARE